MTRGFSLGVLFVSLLMGVVACSSDSSDPPANTGGSAGSGGSNNGGSGGSGGMGAMGGSGGMAGMGAMGGSAGSGGSTVDLGTCTTASADPGNIDPTGTCHEQVNCGAEIAFTTASGNAPTPAGGDFVDGLYVLTAARVYGTVAPTGVTMKVTQLKQGENVYTSVTTSSSDGHTSGTVATSGTHATYTQNCPGPGVQEREYTATADMLLDFDISDQRTIVYEYTVVK